MERVLAILAVLGVMCAAQESRRSERLRPPEVVDCPRDKLTSFTGNILSYQRTSGRLTITIRTDWETTEEFVVNYRKDEDPPKWFLLNTQPFGQDDWSAIESSRGRLKPGMRATVWSCEDGRKPVIDWQPPSDPD